MSSSKPPPGKRLKANFWGKTSSRSGEPAEPSPVANTETAPPTLTINLSHNRPVPFDSQTPTSAYDATLDHESSEHRDLWAIALQRLPEKDRDGLLVSDQISQNDVLEQLSAAVRQQQRSFEADPFQFNFRGRRIVPREIADRALTVLDKFKDIGDVAVNFDPVHAALPWAGFRFLLQIAVLEKKQRCELLLGIEKVFSMTGRYKILEMLHLREKDLTQGQLNLRTALVANCTLILQFLLRVKHVQAKGSIARTSHALFHHGEFSAFFEAAEQHESIIDRAANACESLAAYKDRGRYSETEKRVEYLQNLLKDFKNPLEHIQLGLSYVYTQMELSEQANVLRWISSIAFEDDHYTARKDRTVDSGRWLLQDDRFQAWWRSESSSIMWLHGLPGAGKTKLVSSVIDFAKPKDDDCPSIDPGVELSYYQADSAVAYFYCDRNREDHRDPRSILCSFVRQLSISNDGNSLHSHSVATYEKNKSSGFATSQLSYEQALAHLQVLAQAPSHTLLFLDALDECEESTRTKLVQDLQTLISGCFRPIRIFVSSRPNPDIKAVLYKELNRAIEATDNRDDICRYVENTITDSKRSPPFWHTKLRSDVRQRVFETLTKNAEGNFQWVALQIKQLHTLSTTRDVESRLGRLPKTLKALYDEMYGQIQDTDGCAPDLAVRAFRWVMCSDKTLSPKTLVEAVCQDPFTDAMDDVDDIDIDFVLQACKNLITVDSSGKVCRFSHLSVQEYLENHRFGHREAHELVANTCLKSLNWLEVSGPRSWSELYKYAAMHWNFHVQRSCEAAPGDPRILSLLQRFLGSKEGTSPQYRSWLQIEWKGFANISRQFAIGPHFKCDSMLWDSLSPSERVSLPLAFFGLHHILPALWQSIDLLDCNDVGDSLLVLAARGGQVSTVETLIQAGVNVNSFGFGIYAQTALYTAVASDSIPIARMLLEAGANVNFCAPDRGQFNTTNGQCCSNALQIAVSSGNGSMVNLLLEAGAQVDTVAGHYGTALQAACTFTSIHSSVMAPILLNAGADVNLRGGPYGNALQAASVVSGNEATVKMLLNAGADIYAHGSGYGNALQAASVWGNGAIVKILLSAGADVNTQGGPYGNALQAASVMNMKTTEATIEILLSAGADVNAQGGRYGNALQAASRSGTEGVIKLFLNAGADVNLQGGLFGSALQAAIANGHTNLVKILLKEGSDVNAEDGPYGNSLELAAFNNDKQTLQLLLDAGADIERISRFGKPISAAFIAGAFDIVRSLLANGADMSTLEVDMEQWLKLGPELCCKNNPPEAVQRIFKRPSRAIRKILKSANEWLEDDANRNCPPLIVGPEEIECQMQTYMKRGCVHLEKMIEAREWKEDDFDESSSEDFDSDPDSDSDSYSDNEAESEAESEVDS